MVLKVDITNTSFLSTDGVGVRVGVYYPQTETLSWNSPTESHATNDEEFHRNTPLRFAGNKRNMISFLVEECNEFLEINQGV